MSLLQLALEQLNPGQTPLVVFDLDGTLADITHRLHFIENEGQEDYASFYKACVDDKPVDAVIQILVHMQAAGFKILIATCRSDEVEDETREWIEKHIGKGNDLTYQLLMRPKEDDTTPDDVMKRQWVFDGKINHDTVLCVFEDRDKVVKMWRELGIPCFQVAPGDF
jgi:FMN phosphatase YigB (HAD superfamily)